MPLIQIPGMLPKRLFQGSLFKNPKKLALLLSVLFFALYLAVFRPGYAINDDLNMIALMAGYPAGHAVPFLVFSNVLLGLSLSPLYGLNTSVNWEVLLFVLVHFVSVFSLLELILAERIAARLKVYGVLLACASDAYFLLNLTFTTTAAFACLTGSCLILFAVRSSRPFSRTAMWTGAALVLLGSLIRFEMSLMTLSLALPAAILAYRTFKLVPLLRSVLITAVIAAAAFGFDRLYVRAAPDWHAYDVYNSARSMLHDTHRLENLGRTIRRVGWTANDQELFARWFFPDEQIYSLDKIQYLADHVSAISSNPAYTLATTLYMPFAPLLLPYILLMLSNLLWMYSQGVLRKAALSVLVLWMVLVADNSYFAVAWKIADRMLLSSLSTTAILGFLIPFWMAEAGANAQSLSSTRPARVRLAAFAAALVLLAALALTLFHSIEISKNNTREQDLYRHIVMDLSELQRQGRIASGALIVSPAHGLPLEWSNPFTLDWPKIPYLDTGWMTFSPRYEEVLGQYDAEPLTDALYRSENIYLMTRVNIIPYIGQYYREHEGITVGFQEIYAMPNPYHVPGYDGVYLYKMVEAK